VVKIPVLSYPQSDMISNSLPSAAIATSGRLSPTTTAPSLSTPVITLQDSSIADVLPTALPQPSSRGRMACNTHANEGFLIVTVGNRESCSCSRLYRIPI